MAYFDNSATEAWLSKKWGCFGSSDIAPLMVKTKDGMFGDGALTLIKKVARQKYTLFNMDDKIESHDMRMGKAREAQCVAFYKKLIGFDAIVHCGDANPIFKRYEIEGKETNSGCSPDSIAPLPDNSGRICFGGEFKNPSGDTHSKYLTDISDQYDLKKINANYYGQPQFSMMVYGCDLWHWASYNEYFPLKDKMILIEVKKDEQYCTDLHIRVMQAMKLVDKIIDLWKNGYKGAIDFNKL